MKKHNASVKIWMMTVGLKNKDIARDYGVSNSFVCRFLKGKGVSRGLAAWLINKGCPMKYFTAGKIAE